MSPQPHCDGLPGFNTNVGGRVTHSSNGTQPLLSAHTGWIGTPVHRCTDRLGPYPYEILVSAAGDWVLRLGEANLPFEVGTHAETAEQLNDWVHSRYEEIAGSS